MWALHSDIELLDRISEVRGSRSSPQGIPRDKLEVLHARGGVPRLH